MLFEPTGLQIEVSTDGGKAVLALAGELDADSASSLVADAERLVLDNHTDLVLDCANVSFCDSFGLRAMMLLWDRVQPDGTVTIARPSETLVRILDITGLSERFEIAEDLS